MITMHASARQTDRQTEGQLDEHHGNSAMIHSRAKMLFVSE